MTAQKPNPNPGEKNENNQLEYERPLELAPDQEEEEDIVYRPSFSNKRGPLNPANQDTRLDDSAVIKPDEKGRVPKSPSGEALRWALDALHQPAMAAADWLARDIDPAQPSAAALLSNPQITLNQVRQAKTVFKTMRIVGEKSADRRVGARMYAAAIAAGLVRHGKKVSTQSDAALKRGFQGLLDDRHMPAPLRDLAGMALCMLDDVARGDATHNGDRQSKSA